MKLIVVGSGIVGSACAYTAAGLGAEVVLVDSGLEGQATAAGAGIISPWTSRAEDPAWYAFACQAAREYPGLASELTDAGAGDVSYRKVGALYLAGSGEHAELVAEQLVSRSASAPEIGTVQVLSGPQARMLFPPLLQDVPAVFVGGAARVDGRKMAAALVSAALSRGAQVMSGHATLAFEPGRVTGVTVDGQFVGGDAVVAAAGAWTRQFVGPAGATVRVTPERGQIAHISVEPADTRDWPVVRPAGSGHYLLAFDDSRVVAGATREPDAGFDFRVSPDGLHEVLSQALTVAPGLGTGRYLETRVGFRPVGPDARPLLGAVTGVRGLVVATGLGASGLTTGPRAGSVAALIAMGRDPGIDVEPFDPLR